MKNNITNFTRKLHYVGEVKTISKNEKKSIIKEALDLGFPFRDTLHISKTTYPDYVEMFYPDENLEITQLRYNYNNESFIEFVDSVDIINDVGVYALQYQISEELGFFSELCYLLFYDGYYRFLNLQEAVSYLKTFSREKKINQALQR
jgi:hypothetical protein